MKSETFTYTGGEITNLKFSQQGAIMKFQLSGMGGETVTSLKLEPAWTDCPTMPIFTMAKIVGQEIMTSNYKNLCSTSTTLYLGANGAGITLDTDETPLIAYLMVADIGWLEKILAEYSSRWQTFLSH